MTRHSSTLSIMIRSMFSLAILGSITAGTAARIIPIRRNTTPLKMLLILLALFVSSADAAHTTPAFAAPRTAHAPHTMTAAWTSNGPFGDDATAAAASPNFDADHTVFLGVSYNVGSGATESATAAILRSTDGGTTWAAVWTHQTPADGSATVARMMQIAITPTFKNDRTVFALWSEGTMGGVVRSTDAGASFQDVNMGLSASGFGTTSTANTLSISPQYSTDQTVAVTANNGNTTTSYLSTNGGATWNPVVATGAVNGCAVTGGGFLLVLGGGKLGSYLPAGNAVCSNNQDLLYATSQDSGATWTPQGDIQAADSSANRVESQHSLLYATANGSNLLYTDESGNAIHSGDGGQSWQSVQGSVLGAYTPPGSAGRAPYVFNMPTGGQGIYAVPLWGQGAPHLYHSSDGGASWSLTWAGHGSTFAHDVASAGAHTLFYAAGNEGLLRSTDGGMTWQSVGSFEPPMSAVAVSPSFATDNAAFATDYRSGLATQRGQDQEGYGIFRSQSGGATWHEPEASEPDAGTIWTTADGGGLSLAVSPAYPADHTVFEGDQTGTVHISRDGGATWVPSMIGGQDGWYVSALAVSPRFASDQVVFAALKNQGYGIVRSSDGGQTWMQDVPQDRRDEIADLATYDVQAVADASGVLDVAIAIGGNIYLTQDDGHSATPPEWYAIGQGIGGSVGTVALSPNYPTDCTMYAGTGIVGVPTLDDGLYVSTNACPINAINGTITWTRLSNGLPARDITSIVLSPSFSVDRTLFVSSQTLGVYVSTDAGASWSPLNTALGSLTVNKLALAVTGSQTGMLFAATDNGMWQTPVQLVPASTAPPTTTPTNTATTAPAATNTSAPPSVATNTPLNTATTIPIATNTSAPPPPATTIPVQPAPTMTTASTEHVVSPATSTPTSVSTSTRPAVPTATARSQSGHGRSQPSKPLLAVRAQRSVASGAELSVTVRTAPLAHVSATLRVVTVKVSMMGTGKRRKRTVRTVVLYAVMRQGRADQHGRFKGDLRVTYKVSRSIAAWLTVTALVGRDAVTHATTVTITPQH